MVWFAGYFKASRPKNGKKNGKNKGRDGLPATCISAAYTKAKEHDLTTRPEYKQVTAQGLCLASIHLMTACASLYSATGQRLEDDLPLPVGVNTWSRHFCIPETYTTFTCACCGPAELCSIWPDCKPPHTLLSCCILLLGCNAASHSLLHPSTMLQCSQPCPAPCPACCNSASHGLHCCAGYGHGRVLRRGCCSE